MRSAWVHPLGRTKGVHGTARPGVRRGFEKVLLTKQRKAKREIPFQNAENAFRVPFQAKISRFRNR